MVSKCNNLPAQKGGKVFDSGVGLGRSLNLYGVGKIIEHTLLVPKLFSLEGTAEYAIAVMTCMHC